MEKLEYIKRARAGDKLARDQIIRENMPLVYSIVRRFAGRGYDLEDLGQIGAIGLIKAVDKFDVNYDVKFSTYAVPLIMGEIKRFLRDDGAVKVGRSVCMTEVEVHDDTGRLVAHGTSKLLMLQGRQSFTDLMRAAGCPQLPDKYLD